MKKRGRPKSEVKKERIVTFRLTEEKYEKLKAYTESRGMTVTEAMQKGVDNLISPK